MAGNKQTLEFLKLSNSVEEGLCCQLLTWMMASSQVKYVMLFVVEDVQVSLVVLYY